MGATREQLRRFITNPRPRWWASTATWICLALLTLVLIYVFAGYRIFGQGLRVQSQRQPEGLTPSVLIDDSRVTGSRVPVDLLYTFRQVHGTERAAVWLQPIDPRGIDKRYIELLASNPDVLGIHVEDLPGDKAKHMSLAARSLRAGGATITIWTPTAYILVPLKWLLIALIPLLLAVSLLRARESRRCHIAANRWRAGLCPVCKYPRDPGLDDTCPECGRNMPEHAALAAARLGRDLNDPDAWANERERRRSEPELLHDTTPSP